MVEGTRLGHHVFLVERDGVLYWEGGDPRTFAHPLLYQRDLHRQAPHWPLHPRSVSSPTAECDLFFLLCAM